jgi:hypothetical protein
MLRRRAAAALVLVTISSCRIALEDTVEFSSRSCTVSTSAACGEAVMHSDLTWIETNIFDKCTFSGCHNGAATDAGRMDLSPGKSHAALVNVDSEIASGGMLTGKAKLVTPMEPSRSYLLVMMRQLSPEQHDPPLGPPPASVGYMPQNAGGAVTCCQKLDALTRWIEEGAQNN